MYQKLVKTLKTTETIRVVLLIPGMIFMTVMALKLFRGNNTVDRFLRIGAEL